MALKPKFEAETNQGDTAVAEEPSTASAAADAAQASSAVIVKAKTSVAVVNEVAQRAKSFRKEFEAMRDASDMSYGNYDVFKAHNGSIRQLKDAQTDLGRWAKVRLMAWSDSYVVSPGTDDKGSEAFLAYSRDGRVIDNLVGDDLQQFSGKPVEEYLAYLRDKEGFDRARARRFIDTACLLLGCDSGKLPAGKMIQITLSETSLPTFSKYQNSLIDTARCAELGLPGVQIPEDPFTFYYVRESASKGSNHWTKLKISQTLPQDI